MRRSSLSLRLTCLGIWLSAFCFSPFLIGQDLENVAQNIKRPLTISGGLDLSSNFYDVSGIAPRRDKWQWQMRANLNLNLFGINAPFSMAFSDGNRQFGLPSYTFAGISPSYKWARLHFGDRSLNYSKYTLNSVNFMGAGFELEPGKFYVSGMYGRLRRAVAEDFNSLQSLDPTFKRMGYGSKIGYRGENQEYTLIFFGAHDEEQSIIQPSNSLITPTNNAVISFKTRQRFFQNFTFEGELAHSSFNEDTRAGSLSNNLQNIGNDFGGIFSPTTTYITGDAFRGRLNYVGKNFSLQTGYERIGRGFRTLGALFFLSDAEYYTLGGSTSLMDNKLSLFTNIGIERTNLDNFEKDGTQRFVGSLNANYIPLDRWQFNASYSNFQNSTKIRAFNNPNQLVDSILLAQTTQTASLVTTHQLETENPSMLSLVLTYQEANSIINDIIQKDAQSRFTNSSLMYNITFVENDFNLNSSINYNRTELATTTNSTYSLTLGANKGWFKNKLQTNLRSSFNRITYQNNPDNSVINFLVGGSYRFLHGHALRANMQVLHRTSTQLSQPKFWEWYGQIGYSFNFSESLRSSNQGKIKAQPIAIPLTDNTTNSNATEANPTNEDPSNPPTDIISIVDKPIEEPTTTPINDPIIISVEEELIIDNSNPSQPVIPEPLPEPPTQEEEEILIPNVPVEETTILAIEKLTISDLNKNQRAWLMALAQKHYKDSRLYPTILNANQAILNNWGQLYQGQTILIPDINHQLVKVYYEIRRGENLYRLAMKFNTTVDTLIWLNNIPDVKDISTGKILQIR